MAKKTQVNQNDYEDILAGQMGEFDTVNERRTPNMTQAPQEEPIETTNMATEMLHHRLSRNPGESPLADHEGDRRMVNEKKLSRVGDNILQNASVREGWIPVDRSLLQERDLFYPEDWQFSIRPATVEAIRNWSTIDNENGNSIDEVFNEIMKECLAIKDGTGKPLPWYNVCSWDRFFFVLLIREYTFNQGEHAIRFYEECANCEGSVEFNLNSGSLLYDMPDEEVLKYYDRASRSWMIDPAEYDVEGDPITLFVPTLEKDANIKAWIISRYQENRNAKIDPVFIRFVSWMTPKISKDTEMAKRQMKQLKLAFEGLDIEQFSFMDEVIRNIVVTPSTNMKGYCPSCGEEVTTPIRFPNGVSDLFAIQNRSKRFGKK